MANLYLLFKFLHVVAAIVWIGGVFTLYIINLRLLRSRDTGSAAALSGLSTFFGAAVLGPAAGLTLIAGIVTVLQSDLGFDTFLISWGFVAIFLSLLLGASLIRVTTVRLAAALQMNTLDAARISALRGRLSWLNTLNMLILLSAVWAMVFKPTL